MGARQQLANQILGTAAKGAVVAGVGSKIGEELAKEEGNKALDVANKEGIQITKVDKETGASYSELTEAGKNPYVKIALYAQHKMRTGVPEEIAHEQAVKAAKNLYLKQHNTNAIKLGYQAVIDRVLGRTK